jgi:Flp pilus assembly protein TadG
VALVEFAIFLPLMAMLVFGAIETSNMIYLRQGLKSAAYEVARSVSRQDGVQADAEARGHQALNARGIVGATITITPAVTAQTAPGTTIDVTVSAPADANADGPQWFYQGQNLTTSVRMERM